MDLLAPTEGQAHPLSEPIAREAMRHVLTALTWLDRLGLCHRDVSAENIMLSDENQCVLIDFAMSLRTSLSVVASNRSQGIWKPVHHTR